MTYMRFDTIVANTDPDDRRELIDQLLAELSDVEALNALAAVWTRSIGERARSVVAEYQEQLARIDAEIALAAEDDAREREMEHRADRAIEGDD